MLGVLKTLTKASGGRRRRRREAEQETGQISLFVMY